MFQNGTLVFIRGGSVRGREYLAKSTKHHQTRLWSFWRLKMSWVVSPGDRFCGDGIRFVWNSVTWCYLIMFNLQFIQVKNIKPTIKSSCMHYDKFPARVRNNIKQYTQTAPGIMKLKYLPFSVKVTATQINAHVEKFCFTPSGNSFKQSSIMSRSSLANFGGNPFV